MTQLPHTLPPFAPGTVWLAGAGPGDPGLLTLNVHAALGLADVVVHDALVAPAVLDLIPESVPRESVGKRGGRPSPRQTDITTRLIRLARAGQRVLRLKGGDPFVFGRGGEEALGLVAAGVPFRVLPGITSGLAGPALAGIPLTTRDTNAAAALVTGQDADGVPDLDWTALAGVPVLVFYMARRAWPTVAAALTAAGRSAAEPVAVIWEATTPRQQVAFTTLTAAAAVLAEGGSRPAIVVVGPVVPLGSVLGTAAPEADHGQFDSQGDPQ